MRNLTRMALIVLVPAWLGCGDDQARERELRAAETAAYEKGKAETAEASRKERDESERKAAVAQMEAEQRAEAARQEASERAARERAALRHSPDRFFEITNTAFHDKGIVNSYRQLNRLTVLNKSRYSVKDVTGEVDWFSTNGTKIGTTTFTLAGSLPAGETKTYDTQSGSLTSGTLEGTGVKWEVRVTHVEVIE